MNFLEGLDQEDLEKTEEQLEKEQEKDLFSIERDLFMECAGVVSSAARAAQIDPANENPPEDWIEQLGEEKAHEAMKVARFAHLPKKDAPMFIDLCSKMLMGVIQARAKRKSDQHRLQVNVVGMTAPTVRELE